jgi:hypothetical protein
MVSFDAQKWWPVSKQSDPIPLSAAFGSLSLIDCQAILNLGILLVVELEVPVLLSMWPYIGKAPM